MSDDIKVGDVCVIVDGDGFDLFRSTIGCECVVVDHWLGPNITSWKSYVVDVGGFKFGIYAHCLRKKPPKSDDSEWIRQETVPLERFNEWRERVRRQEPVEETA